MTLQIPRAITSIRQNDRQLERMSRWMDQPEDEVSPRRHRQIMLLSKRISAFESVKYDPLFIRPSPSEMEEMRLMYADSDLRMSIMTPEAE